MYDDDAADEELRVAVTAVVDTGTIAWLLLDANETEVEDDDKEAEATAEAHRDVELRAAAEGTKVATERVKVAEEEAVRR
jgi:hypothetical protein